MDSIICKSEIFLTVSGSRSFFLSGMYLSVGLFLFFSIVSIWDSLFSPFYDKYYLTTPPDFIVCIWSF